MLFRSWHGSALDICTYQGGFAIHLAQRCERVTGVDASRGALEVADRNLELNSNLNGRVAAHVEWIEADAFELLREYEANGERYDTIVLDPPAFAKNKASIPNAIAGYKEINLRAMRLLNPGGYLITCSCSYNVNEEMFASIIHDASVDSHTPVTMVEKRMQGRDHPVLIGVSETFYLKCFILRRVE